MISVIGSGIAGSEFVRQLRISGIDEDITVYSNASIMHVQALYPEVLGGLLDVKEISVDLRPFYDKNNIHFVFDDTNYTVPKEDMKVVATGMCQKKIFDQQGVYGCGDIYDMMILRNRFQSDCPKNVVVIGAGMTGIEFATIINNCYYTKVRLVEAMNNILPGLHPHVQDGVNDYLRKSGIDVYNRSVTLKIHDQVVYLEDGKKLPADLVVWTGGLKPSQYLDGLVAPKRYGYLRVDPYLKYGERRYAIGDNAWIEIDGKIASRNALEAEKQATYLAACVKKEKNGDRVPKYKIASSDKSTKAFLTVGVNKAFGIWGRYLHTFRPEFTYKVKNGIDKSFLDRFRIA